MKTFLEQHEAVFLQLLRSALWGVPPDVPEDFREWSASVRLAKEQSMLGMISRVILSDNLLVEKIPSVIRLKMKSFIVSNAMMYDKIESILATLLKTMSENEIPTVLLKGYGLSVNYPMPKLRQNGHIVLYVGEDRYAESYGVLKKLADDIDHDTEIWKSKHYHASIDGVLVEVHRFCEVLPLKRYDRRFQSFASRGMADCVSAADSDIDVKVPEPTFNSLYIFVHMFSHFMTEGVGIRQLCDWMMHLNKHQDQIDKARLTDMLDKLNLRKAWDIFAEISVAYLGYPDQAMPLSRKSDAKMKRRAAFVLETILDEGNFGHASPYYRKQIEGFFGRKLYSIGWHIRRDLKLLGMFPDYTFGYFCYILRRGATSITKHLKEKNGR